MSTEQPHSLPRQELRVVKGDNFKADPWDYRYESGKSSRVDPETGEHKDVSHFTHARTGEEVRYHTKELEDFHDKEQLAGKAHVYDVGRQTLRAVGVEEPLFHERQAGFRLLERVSRRLNGGFTVKEPLTQAYVERRNGDVESGWETIMDGTKVDSQGNESDWVVVAQFNKRGVLEALKDVPLALHEKLQKEHSDEKKPALSLLEEQEAHEVKEGLTDGEFGNMVKTLDAMQVTLEAFEVGLKSRTKEVFTEISSDNSVDTGRDRLIASRKQIDRLIATGDPRLSALQDEILRVDELIASVDNDYALLKDMVTIGIVPRLHEISKLKQESWQDMQQRVGTMKAGLQEAQSLLRELMKKLEEPEAVEVFVEGPVEALSSAVPSEAMSVQGVAEDIVHADIGGVAPEEETPARAEHEESNIDVVVTDDTPRKPENDLEPSEQERNNLNKAVVTITTILGENKKGGGTLGEKLKALGVTPEEIVHTLRKPGETRDAVLAALRMRTQHLYHQFESEEKKVFLAGVSEARSKPINVSDAKNGETQMGSLDKVALLALAMLDGTFRTEDDVVKNKADGGNHRDVAEKVLADFAKEQVVDVVEMVSESEALQRLLREASQKLGNTALEMRRVSEYLRQWPESFRQRLNAGRPNLREMHDELQANVNNVLERARQEAEGIVGDMSRAIQEQEEINYGKFEGVDRQNVDKLKEDARLSAVSISNLLHGPQYPVSRIQKVLEELEYAHNPEPYFAELQTEFRRLEDTKATLLAELSRLAPYREAS